MASLVHLFSHWLDTERRKDLAREVSLLHDSIQTRFIFLLDTHLTMGLLAARYVADTKFKNESYKKICQNIVKIHEEIEGVNFVDETGVISKVCPLEKNKMALGRKSQNIEELKHSYQNNDRYWFSGPFELYQRGLGFVFYVPVVFDGGLKGWLALPMTYKKFFDNFHIENFLKNHHLIIRDDQSGKYFFSSTAVPNYEPQMYKKSGVMFGRKITFYSWDKSPLGSYEISWIFSLVIGLIIASLSTLALRNQILRRREERHATKINDIVSYAIQQSSTALTAFSQRLQQQGKANDDVLNMIFYLNNLIYQLSTSSNFKNDLISNETQKVSFKEILNEQVVINQSALKEKKVCVKANFHDEQDIIREGHKWLLGHSVIGNILRYLIYNAKPGTDVQVIFFEEDNSKIISFHSSFEKDDVLSEEEAAISATQQVLNKGLEVAQEVLIMMHIDLSIIRKDLNRTIVIKF
jgi:hypothetical protein